MSDASANAGNSSAPHSAPGGLAGGVDALGDNALFAAHERLLRDKEEPKEGFSIIPIILIFLGCALTYVGGINLAQHSGNFKADVFDFNWRPGEGGQEAPDLMKIGGRVFVDANCQNCHGPQGAGQPGQYPPLALSPWLHGAPDRAISVVLLGMSGNVNVNGNVVTGGSMPSVGKGLSDLQVAAVLTYVRASFGNQEEAVDPATVTKIRADIGGNPNPWHPEDLLKLYPLGDAKPATPAGSAAASGSAAPAASAASGSAK